MSSTALVDSHVLPEMLFRATYDSKHRAIKVHLEPAWKGLIQKGLRESLLCTDCEARLNVFEVHFDHAWFVPQHRVRPAALTVDLTTIRGLDYAKFKLFCLSLLWRSSVSRLPEFAEADLGTKHEARIRSILLTADPGQHDEYRLWAIGLVNEGNTFQDGIIKCPQRLRIEGHNFYLAIFGGCAWFVAISPNAVDGFPKTSALSTAGTLIVGRELYTDFRAIRGAVPQFRKAATGRRPPPRIPHPDSSDPTR